MYINLILGAVALVIVWLFLKKLLVREDVLKESPAALLEREIARRRAREDTTEKAFERLRDKAKSRLRPVAEALMALQAALPGTTRNALSWEDTGASLVIHMHAAGHDAEAEKSADLTVTWRVPELDLRAAAQGGDDIPGVFVLRRSDTGKEESLAALDACVRHITSFIVDFME